MTETLKRTRLTNLRLRRVDFVDEGDNPGAVITLAKARARVLKNGALTTGEALNRREVGDALQCLYSALSEAVWNNLYSDATPAEKAANIKTSVEQFATGLASKVDQEFAEDAAGVVGEDDEIAVTDLTIAYVEKQADAALGRALRVIRKIAGQSLHVPDIDPAYKERKKMADEKDEKDKDAKEKADLKAKFEKRDGEATAAAAEVVTLKARVVELEAAAKAANDTPEAIEKRKLDALPVEVRKQIEEDRAEIKKLREAGELVVFEKQAKELDIPGTTPEALAPVLRDINKGLTPESAKEVVRLLKSAGEMAKRGQALTSIGTPGARAQEGSALAEVAKRVGELRAKDAKLGYEAAHNTVMQDQELAKRVTSERFGAQN